MGLWASNQNGVPGGLPFANGIVGLGGEIAWPRPTRPGDILHVERDFAELEGVVRNGFGNGVYF